MKKIEIFDSSLRDGSQGEGISFSVQDKLNIVKTLDEFGVDIIEAGNPVSNPKDMIFFKEVKKLKLKNSRLAAFGSTIRKGNTPETDLNLQSLIEADTPVTVIFGKTWDLHVTHILKISLEDNEKIVYDTVAYLKSKNKEVVFDAEHFYDGYKNNPQYALSVLSYAVKAGADCLALCDTNGGCLPEEIKEITKTVCEAFPDVKIGIHCHDDCGCGVANSVSAVLGGASQVQGTFIGYGERCGNANLSVILPTLMLKCGYSANVDLKDLKHTAGKISEISNVVIRNNTPYIGKSAFSHKAGMHIDGVKKISASFEHINPELVGNERRFLISEVAGRGTILPKIQKFAPHITKDSPETEYLTSKLKELELYGYQYEGAEASFELFIKKHLGLQKPYFKVIMYKATDDFPAPDGELQSNAMVKIAVNGETEIVAAEGNGPVNALDKAFRKALCIFYPELNSLRLIDYKVRVIDSKSTDARTRVLIESTDGETTFTTIGVSSDIIEASFTALTDSYEYTLSKKIKGE